MYLCAPRSFDPYPNIGVRVGCGEVHIDLKLWAVVRKFAIERHSPKWNTPSFSADAVIPELTMWSRTCLPTNASLISLHLDGLCIS